jgi:uncharacterized protein YndB with AHSA1/START domain
MNWTERRKRQARRRAARRVLLTLAAGLALLAAIGLALGPERAATEQALFARPPETVWRVLLDLDGMPLWRSDLRALERLPDLEGRPAWREIGRNGVRVMELASAVPPTRLVFRQTRAGVPAFPVRTFELAAVPGGGTRLTLTERSRVGNPVRRVLDRIRPPTSELSRLLRDLEQRLGGARRDVASRAD